MATFVRSIIKVVQVHLEDKFVKLSSETSWTANAVFCLDFIKHQKDMFLSLFLKSP